MEELRSYLDIKDKLRMDEWEEQVCGEIYQLSSIGTNFFKNDTILHLSIEINVDKETIDNLKGKL